MSASRDRFRCVHTLAIALFSFASAQASASSPDQRRLTLADAIDRAASSVPAITASSLQVDAARTAEDEARAGLRPRAWASANGVENDKPTITSPFHGFGPGITPEFERTLLQAGLNLDYTVYDGGATPARLEQARHEIAAATHGYAATRDEIVARTAINYLDILARARMLGAHRQRIRALQAEQDRVETLYRVGRAADVELFRVQAALAAAEAERTDLAASLDAAERSMARLLGVDPAETRAPRLADVKLVNDSLPDRKDAAQKANAGNPRIAEASERAMSLHASIGLARSAYLPKLDLFGKLVDYRTLDRAFETDWQAGVQVRIPLWDGGVTAARVARARASTSAADESVRQARLEIGQAIDDRIAAIERSRASSESLTRAVKQYEEVARIEKLRLENGVGTQTDYLRAEADLVRVRASLATSRYQQIISRIDLARVTGELDRAWIEQQLRNAP